MTHETAQQRYRRLKADKLRRAQIAPVHTVEPVRCARDGCQHARLMHDVSAFQISVPRCLAYGCGCTEYVEA